MADSALAVRGEQAEWSPKQKQALLALGVNGGRTGEGYLPVDEGDWTRFLVYCQRTKLDPFANQIYMIARMDNNLGRYRQTIQVGIDGLRVIAERTGTYEGQTPVQWCGPDGKWTDVWLKEENPKAARVGVYRRGFREPLVAVALWSEYSASTTTWRKYPTLMLAKVAEALALRKAFPNDLGGLFIQEEFDVQEDQTGAADRPGTEVNGTTVIVSSTMAEETADNREHLVAEMVDQVLKAPDRARLGGLWTAALAAEKCGHLVDGLSDEATVTDLFAWRAQQFDQPQQPETPEAPPAPENPEPPEEPGNVVDAEIVEPAGLTAEEINGMGKARLKAAYRDTGTPWEEDVHGKDLPEARAWLIQVLGLDPDA